MAFDSVVNFGKVTVSIGYDSSAISIVLNSGDGAKLPSTTPYNIIWWNSTDYVDPTDDPNVEIVRVTARSTDTLTVTRAQEGTSASNKNTAGKTYKMILALTAKMITDIDAGKVSSVVAGTNITVDSTDPKNPIVKGLFLPGARVFNSVDQSVANTTIVAFDSERWDTDNIHDNVTNNSRLTCNTPGKYLITFHGRLTGAASSMAFQIYLNGATIIAYSTSLNASSGDTMTISTIYDLAANDYVQIRVVGNATVTLSHAANYSAEFMMQRIG